MNLWQTQNEQVRLSLHPGQARAWRSNRRFTFILSGTQGGKTSFGPWWLWREIKNCGQGDYLAVTASFDLFKLKMLPEIRTVFETILKLGRWWAGDKVLELRDPATGEFWAKRADDPMWGRIILRSAHSSGGLESATGKAAWLDECGQDSFVLENWEAVLRRLSLSQGRVLGTTTLYNAGWLKSEVYDPWVDGDKDFEVVQFASILNPAFPRAEFERAGRKVQDHRFSMFYLGQFSRPPGLIYGDFTDGMLCDPFPIPLDWRRVVGIDFGGANTATVWLAEDPDTEIWYIYRETLEGGKSSSEHVGAANEAMEEGAEYTFVGGAGSEGQQRADWEDAGLPVKEPVISGLEAGIDRVIGLIKPNHLRVFRTLKGTRDEIGGYRRKSDSAGDTTDEIVNKRKYHRLDGLRYAAVYIDAPDRWRNIEFLSV